MMAPVETDEDRSSGYHPFQSFNLTMEEEKRKI